MKQTIVVLCTLSVALACSAKDREPPAGAGGASGVAGTGSAGGGPSGGGASGAGGVGGTGGAAGTTASCNPVDPFDSSGGWTPCTSGQTCVPATSSGKPAVCETSFNRPAGSSCAVDADCSPGFACEDLYPIPAKCAHWCASFADCPTGATGCDLVAPAYVGYAGTTKYGVCK